MSTHILSVLMDNQPGALSRLVGLFSARGYNIESLNVATTEDFSVSRLTLVTSGSDQFIEQIVKQLNKLIDVIKVVDLTQSRHVEREVMLIKVDTSKPSDREEVKRLTDIFRGQIIDVTQQTYTIQILGTYEKLNAFLQSLDDGIVFETVRSGVLGIQRGSKSLNP